MRLRLCWDGSDLIFGDNVDGVLWGVREYFEECFGDVFIGIIEDCLFSARVEGYKLSQVQYFVLVEEQIPMLLLTLSNPLLN